MEITNSVEIGKAISSIRRERELSQTELAQRANLSNSYLSEIEANKRTPDLNVLKRIADALNVPIELLMIKAVNEQNISDPDQKRLAREIAPLLENLVNILYQKPAVV
jgi:XRE family transcriptional regulator, regulator of sulfur utilization